MTLRRSSTTQHLAPFFVVSATVVALLLAGCGLVGKNSEVRLGVPYRAQPVGSFWCGPASVLMWRLYDGLPEIPQATIADFMGGASCGVMPQDISDAVNFFTNATDTFVDLGDANHVAHFMARQITSIDAAVPVIAIVDDGFHAGVVNGGSWSPMGSGMYRWDTVLFHDPLRIANDRFIAGDWIDKNCGLEVICQQVVSSFAIIGWSSNFSTFHDSVIVEGFNEEIPLP